MTWLHKLDYEYEVYQQDDENLETLLTLSNNILTYIEVTYAVSIMLDPEVALEWNPQV